MTSIWNPGGVVSVPSLPAVAPVAFVKSTAASPGITFVGDTDTGIWSQADGYLNFAVNGVTKLTVDPLGNVTANKFTGQVEADVASAAVTDIGSVISNVIRITGSNNINSFGVNYNGPMFVRFAAALAITTSTSIILPGGSTVLAVVAGDSCVIVPKATAGVADGWVIVSYTRASGAAISAGSQVAVSGPDGTAFTLRNRITNGNFDIWQRGTSFASVNLNSAAASYTADRWQGFRAAGAAGATFSRVAYNGSGGTNDTGSAYAMRVQRDSGNASLAPITLGTTLETIVDIYKLRNKTVTVSFWMLLGTNFSGGVVTANLYTGTGTDSSLYAGITTPVIVGGVNVSSAIYTKYTFTAVISNSVSQLGLGFSSTPTGTAGTNDYFEVSSVQLELGGTATPFEQRPYTLELALCQRYYQQIAISNISYNLTGQNVGSCVPFLVLMRTTPSITQLTNNFLFSQNNVTATTSTYFSYLTVVTAFRVASTSNSCQFSELVGCVAEL